MVKLETIASSVSVPWDEGRTKFAVLVRVTAPPQCTQRHSVDLVAVLDTSGSMGLDGKLESMKQAMVFVIDNLGKDDRLSILPFRRTENDDARCPLTVMSAENRENLKTKVNMLQAVPTTGNDEGTWQQRYPTLFL
jgi:Mg-chelatase subunit ChlD